MLAVVTAGEREPGKIFLSGKQCTISLISSQPNFTKFEHKTSIGEAMKKLSEQNFENFTVKMSNVLRLQDEITPLDYRSPETHYQMIPVLDV